MIHKKCRMAGCGELTDDRTGYCTKHRIELGNARKKNYYRIHPEYKERERTSAAKRGYDYTWQVFAKKFLQEHPICALCGRPSTVCDHKDIPAQIMINMWGKFDLEPDLYQALCTSCNNRKRKQDRARINKYEEDKFKLDF